MTVARATPIDRTELVRLIEEDFRVAGAIWDYDSEALADRIIATIKPIEGIVLTEEDAARAEVICRAYDDKVGSITARTLADRLEAVLLNT